ncbi:MAG: hypothetical protein ACRCZD_07465 [Phycicoccus sp.]
MSTDPSRDVVLVARAAAEAVRALGHQLVNRRLDVIEVYDLLAELALLASRYPHLLARLDDALTSAADDSELVVIDDLGRRHDPATTLVAIGAHLTAAGRAAHALTVALDAAHEHTSRLAHPGP